MAQLAELRFHGGQSWAECSNFIQDFSVTTNALGTPQSGKRAVIKAMEDMHHYPPANQEPALSETAEYFWPTLSDDAFRSNKERLILGNGSSDVIDLAIRYASKNGAQTFRPGPTLVQYKDYERCALASGMDVKGKSEESSLLCMVNPTNPTGDFMPLREVKAYIENHAKDNSFVTVDESMLFWYGPDWRSESLTQQTDWVTNMWLSRGIKIFIIHSWTKIWSCCGLRLGSIIAPSVEVADKLRTMQTPWSVNAFALAFMSAALKDDDYFERTWEFTKLWRAAFLKRLEEVFPDWQTQGAPFTSWIWVDTGSIAAAKTVHDVCKVFGVPIRWAKHGYKQPSCIRFGVRKPEFHNRMFEALQMAKRVLDGDDEDAQKWAEDWLTN